MDIKGFGPDVWMNRALMMKAIAPPKVQGESALI